MTFRIDNKIYSNFSIAIFLSLICLAVFHQPKTNFISIFNLIKNLNIEHNDVITNISFAIKNIFLFIKKFFIFLYKALYYEIWKIPLFFWLIVLINIILIISFKFENFKENITNLQVLYLINKNIPISQKYIFFQNFISSSYGVLSIASISETIVLLYNYNTPGSIFWMVITVLLMGGIQMIEIIINCNYIKQTNQKTGFISAFQYLVNKYNQNYSKKSLTNYIIKFAGMYAILTIMISFFSALLFQVEQFGNIFYRNRHGSDIDQFIVIAIFAPILLSIFLISSFSHFKHGLKFNIIFLPPILMAYLLIIIIFCIVNSNEFISISLAIIDGIFDKDAILPGIISGAVISFARYIYKSRDFNEDTWHIYEESDGRKSIIMYSLESFFMIALIILSGISFLMIENFNNLQMLFGINIKHFFLIILLIFAFSLIINEAFYGRIVLSHLIRFGEKNLNLIIRSIMVIGIIFGLFKQTDQWVDIADRISITFLMINLISILAILPDAKNSLTKLKFNNR